MKRSKPISQGDLIDSYEESIRDDLESEIKAVMWLAIYDAEPASTVRDLLEKKGILSPPKDQKAKRAQLRKLERRRQALEESVGLPAKGRKGATTTYRQALSEWKRINRRPTKEDFNKGWAPLPLSQSLSHVADEIAPSMADEAASPPHSEGMGDSDLNHLEGSESPSKKRKSVPPPPDYRSGDYQPKPTAPIDIKINPGRTD